MRTSSTWITCSTCSALGSDVSWSPIGPPLQLRFFAPPAIVVLRLVAYGALSEQVRRLRTTSKLSPRLSRKAGTEARRSHLFEKRRRRILGGRGVIPSTDASCSQCTFRPSPAVSRGSTRLAPQRELAARPRSLLSTAPCICGPQLPHSPDYRETYCVLYASIYTRIRLLTPCRGA